MGCFFTDGDGDALAMRLVMEAGFFLGPFVV
jgi:hypothetical protein